MRKRIVFVTLALTLAACDGKLSLIDGDNSGDGGTGNPTQAAIAKANFDANVRPLLQSTCVPCHGMGSPAYPQMMGGDIYSTLKGTAGMIVPHDPGSSRLYVYGQSSAHTGPKLTSAQAQVIADWINLEPVAGGSADAGTGSANTTLMTPVTGMNTVDLSQVNSMLAGATLTFSYTPLTGGMYFSQIKITAGSGMGIHAFHPLFVFYPTPADPHVDPVDSFYGLDLTIPASMNSTLGGGSVALTNVPANSQLSIRFERLEPSNGMGPDAGPAGGGGCKDVPTFTAMAKPALGTICTGCTQACVTCHGGGNTGATNAFDLSKLNDTTPAGQLAACNQVKGKINFGTPANSILFQRPKPPQSTGHSFTFPDITTFTNFFQNPILQWVAKEQ